MTELLNQIKENYIFITIFTSFIAAIVGLIFTSKANMLQKERLEKTKEELNNLQKENSELKSKAETLINNKKEIETEKILYAIIEMLKITNKSRNNKSHTELIKKYSNNLNQRIRTNILCSDTLDIREMINVHKMRGFFYLFENDFAQSMEHYENLAKEFPNNSEYMRMIGILLMHQAIYDKALISFELCMKRTENLRKVCVYNNYGEVYQHMKKYEEAKQYYTQAINVVNEESFFKYLPYFNLGILNCELKKIDKKIDKKNDEEKEYYLKALEYNSSHHRSLYNLSCIYCDEGNIELSVKYFKKAYCSNSIEVGLIANYDDDIAPIRNHPDIKKLLDPSILLANVQAPN